MGRRAAPTPTRRRWSWPCPALTLALTLALAAGCGQARLTVANTSTAWLRVQAALTPPPGEPTPLRTRRTRFGVPPGGRIERPIPGDAPGLRRAPNGLVALVQATDRGGEAPTYWRVTMPPPGPYRLHVAGTPESPAFERTDARGDPMEDDRLVVRRQPGPSLPLGL